MCMGAEREKNWQASKQVGNQPSNQPTKLWPDAKAQTEWKQAAAAMQQLGKEYVMVPEREHPG